MAGTIHAVDAPKAGTAVQYVKSGVWRKATVKRAEHKANRYTLTNHAGQDITATIKNGVLHFVGASRG